MKRVSFFLGALALTTIASAAETKVGVTVYRYDDNFMSTVRQRIEEVAKNDKDVEVLMNDSQNDQSKQNDQVDILIAKGVNSLAINLVDPAAASTVIAKAKAEDIPVVFYNKEPSQADMDSYDKAYYVGTDSKESGVIQGEVVAKHWKANPKWDLNKDRVIQYVLLKGEPGHPDAEARTTYVTKTLNDNFKIKTDELHMDTAMWDAAMAKDKIEAWLSGPNGEKIEVIVANNDGMAMGAVEALKANGKPNIPVFGVDALSEVLVMIEKGEMAGTVLNDGINQGQAAYEIARNLGQGKSPVEGTKWKLNNRVLRIPYVGVDKDNLNQFKK
ncbi:galactose/glucose ABC transporter substrate-binding protein MglB [uncultured Cetobacterium sp.]|uniref:galactose/glucose ABC transporter substrate-binding protein MglB n=1 Tax=uncultured Cetobacterium sp. TaxID=527638 RepID=UPI00262F5906|nr:galactose/glucose ABC transporter substrate-binding protein MglB [uncultured Cetobacterium sp.]